MLKTPTRRSHQIAEPRNTPSTSIPAEVKPPLVPAKPNPAKTAAKEKIVIGFVSVRRNVEVCIPAYRRTGGGSSRSSFGTEISVFVPRKHRNVTPTSLSQNWWPIRKFDTKVRPKAAMKP